MLGHAAEVFSTRASRNAAASLREAADMMPSYLRILQNQGRPVAAGRRHLQPPEADPGDRCRSSPGLLPDTAECCCNKSHSSNQVTISPPRRRQPHRVARPATSRSPRPPSASRPAGCSSGVPSPARSVTSTRTMPSPALTATVTVSPGALEPECRTLLLKISLTSKMATSPHGCPGPSTSDTNARAARARSARPASVTLSRTATLAITAPALPGHPGPGNRPGSGRT